MTDLHKFALGLAAAVLATTATLLAQATYYPTIDTSQPVDIQQTTVQTVQVTELDMAEVRFAFAEAAIAVTWSDGQQVFIPFTDLPQADRTALATWMETKLGPAAMAKRPDQQTP